MKQECFREAIMKKGINILALIITAFTLTAVDALSQASSTATMQVRVEVVNGSQITRNYEAEDTSIRNGETVYGDFTMNIPEGAEILTEAGDNVELTNGQEDWKLDAEMIIERGEDGEIHLRFVTRNSKSVNRSGTYHGTQMATIHYL
ncbi:hypothetical protein [Rhodohalobacter halophilus]|uniref:hypothetical protein n=1 Tax=Rhodohalobacter halophilus TaxID=1812810 RepID=UPI0015B6F95E|nr:hypothetical protein [Rhodohalobacter halophilus]